MLTSAWLNSFKTSTTTRGFSTSARCWANRAIVYKNAGDPKVVLTALTYPSLAPPPPQSLNVRFVLSPINPADVNVVEGVYPAKPTPTDSLTQGHKLGGPVMVGGNEGLAEVIEVGEGVEGLRKGDWVVMAAHQLGTWSSAKTIQAKDVIKVSSNVSEVTGATLTVNPPTAYNMLHDFAQLQPGDWVMQNGANSAVGQMVIQIAARRGFKTLNFVRNRDNLDALKQQLTSLGATEVLTYDELENKSLRDKIKELTGGSPIRLLLNCVSGPVTTQMLKHLGSNAHLVSYGAMSKQPLSLPTSAFIFKNLTCHGFWQSRWAREKSNDEREELMNTLVDMKLKEPEHEVVTVSANESDGEATEKIREIFNKLSKGQYGKKVLLKLEQPGA